MIRQLITRWADRSEIAELRDATVRAAHDRDHAVEQRRLAEIHVARLTHRLDQAEAARDMAHDWVHVQARALAELGVDHIHALADGDIQICRTTHQHQHQNQKETP